VAEMTTYERALQIYQVLIAAAHSRQTLTYELVGRLIGVPGRGLGRHLVHILRYCEQNELPPLTVLIVKKGVGRPGTGFTTSDDANRDRERVYTHPWFRMKPLTVQDLIESNPPQ
jgi:hypothetical protein